MTDPHTPEQQAAAAAVHAAARAFGQALHAAELAGLRVEVDYRPTEWMDARNWAGAAGAGGYVLISGEPAYLAVRCYALLTPEGVPA